MKQPEISYIIELHERWLKGEAGGKPADLRGADLSYLDLSGANLKNAEMSDVNLSHANLSGAILDRANLRSVDFRGANLRQASLIYADLRWSVLDGADLYQANFRDARLDGIAYEEVMVPWYSRTFVSRILRDAAADDVEKQMIAAFIGTEHYWCWRDFIKLPTSHRKWAIDELKKWVKKGDDAPDILLARSDRE
jgi:hypothetical protein